MNAITTVEPALPRAPFDDAREAVAVWRGRCLDVFARSEAAVSETLLLLAAAGQRGTPIKLPHLVGQRHDALASAIGRGAHSRKRGRVRSVS